MSTSRCTRSGRRLLPFLCACLIVAGCLDVGPERPLAEIVAAAEKGDAAAARELVDYFGHQDPEVAQKAWEDAVRIGAPLESHLIRGLDSSDPDIGEHAAGALGAMRSASAVQALEKALERPRFRRYVAAWALGEIGDPSAIPALVGALGDEDGETRKYSTRSLVKFGPAAVPPLIGALGSEEAPVRRYAVRALGEIRDPRAAGPLLAIEGRVDREVFLWALGRIGDVRGYPMVAAAARDDDWRIRLAAVQALGDLGDGQAVPLLEETLEDGEWIVREWSARSLESVTGDRYQYRNQKGEDVYPYNLYR